MLTPKFQKIFELMGKDMKLAGKRHSLTTIQVKEHAGIVWF